MSKKSIATCMIFCLALGVADLLYLNFQVFPALWPERPSVQATTGKDLAKADSTQVRDKQRSLSGPESETGVKDQGRTVSSTGKEPVQEFRGLVRKEFPRPAQKTQTPVSAEQVPAKDEPLEPEPEGAQKPSSEAVAATTEPEPKDISGQKPVQEIVLYFRPSRYKLAPSHRKKLQDALKPYSSLDHVWVDIGGHADRTGSGVINNRRLSRRRADSVAEFMQAQGIDKRRIKAKGYGTSRPVDVRSTPEAWAKNRRAVVRLSKDTP